jgi:hypothetical protein
MFVLMLAVALSGCSGSVLTATPEGVYEVDPVFREFYSFLGGRDVLGPAISAVYLDGVTKIQFTTTAQLIFDPNASQMKRFQLGPLGTELGIAEPLSVASSLDGRKEVNGRVIFSDFIPLYERLLGERFVGRPLTEVRYNPEEKRYEQYFENLGFYRQIGDAPSDVKLLAYGAWKCTSNCRTPRLDNARVSNFEAVDPMFKDGQQRLGARFTGYALAKAYRASDGKIEQIFENLVLVSDPEKPEEVFLRPVQKLGIHPDALSGPDNASGKTKFIPVSGGKGYNVLTEFLEFINLHGGMKFIGDPITRPSAAEGGGQRQCFTNLCLISDPTAAAAFRVRPEPLGYQYKAIFIPNVKEEVVPVAPDREITLHVWERYPLVASSQRQEIGVDVVVNGIPAVGVQATINIKVPGGQTLNYQMPTTGKDGQSRMEVDRVSASNGTLIPYRVCVSRQNRTQYCVKDSYLIWNNP